MVRIQLPASDTMHLAFSTQQRRGWMCKDSTNDEQNVEQKAASALGTEQGARRANIVGRRARGVRNIAVLAPWHIRPRLRTDVPRSHANPWWTPALADSRRHSYMLGQ